MLRLIDLLKETLKSRKSTYGEYIRIDFSDNGYDIGYTNIRLKKGWNQLHVEVYTKFQNKGYAILMIEYNIKEYGYVVFPDDRITNTLMQKIIKKFQNNTNYEVFRTEYNETVISDRSKTKQEILNVLQ